MAAQEIAGEKEKEKEKKEGKKNTASSSELVNIKGSLRCDKPSPSYSIDVPDRDGHSLIVEKRNCSWTEPMVILGAKTKEGVWVTFIERMEGRLHPAQLRDGHTRRRRKNHNANDRPGIR